MAVRGIFPNPRTGNFDNVGFCVALDGQIDIIKKELKSADLTPNLSYPRGRAYYSSILLE